MSQVLSAIKFYQWVFCMCGLTPPPVLTSHLLAKSWKAIIGVVFLLYSLAWLVGVIFFNFVHFEIIQRSSDIFEADTLTKVLGYSASMTSSLVYVVIMVQTLTKFHCYKDIMESIEELETELETSHVLRLSTMKRRIFLISGSCVAILIISFLYIQYILTFPGMDTNHKVLLLLFLVTMQMKCIEYGMYIQIVESFLEHLIKSLEYVKKDIEAFASHGVPWPLLWQLVKNQMVLNRLWLLVKKLENYFGWPILILFYHNAIAVLSVVNWAYVRRISDKNSLSPYFRLSYIVDLMSNLLILCMLAEKCLEKYQIIGSMIHNFNVVVEDRPLIMRLREYSLQMEHQKWIFTCNGYIDINLSSFGKTLLAITAYVVILIQFQLEDNKTGSVLPPQYIFSKTV